MHCLLTNFYTDRMQTDTRIKILLTDDRPENLLALEAILDSPSYGIVKARSGEEALKALLTHSFGLILLDVQMPGLNGFETAKLIKARGVFRHIPIIFMSAIHKAYEYVLKGYAAGGVDYLFTPFDPDIVRAKVAALVELHHQSGSLAQEQADVIHQNERRKRYRNLADSIPIIVWTARLDGPIDYINKEWRNYTGLTSEQSKGWRWMEAVHQEDLQECLDHLTHAIRRGQGCEVECRLRGRDGSYRWHRLQTVPEKALKGELIGWFGSAIDIHDQKQEAWKKKLMRLS